MTHSHTQTFERMSRSYVRNDFINTPNRKQLLAAATRADPRWESIVNRNGSADGTFVYSVRTTGVYCRPSCAARTANPENVHFHASIDGARTAGFRPCKRCKPDLASKQAELAAKIAQACRFIEESDQELKLADLAAKVSMSEYYFHRTFKALTGLTPKDYAAGFRAKRMRQNLDTGAKVVEAIYDSGYNSNSRFYENSNEVLGMTPSAYRSGGTSAEIRFAIGQSSLGPILVARSAIGICAIMMGEDPDQLARDVQDQFPNANLIGDDKEFDELISKVVGFVEAPHIGLELPLDIRGTAFQQRVWKALRDIPAGSTASYVEVARKLGLPNAARAVAQACAANALAVAIPCHRVVRSNGQLSGYRWGVARKEALLKREANN